jgi:hypothetical protein
MAAFPWQLLLDLPPLTTPSRPTLVSWGTNKDSEPFDDGGNNTSKSNDVHYYRICSIWIFCNKQNFYDLMCGCIIRNLKAEWKYYPQGKKLLFWKI